MEAREIGVLLHQAGVQRRLGNYRGAIEILQRALALDPDHAVAHAALAISLLRARRLPGAKVEIRIALDLDGDDRYVHEIAAHVRMADREFADAWAHCLLAIGDGGAAPEVYVLASSICSLRGDAARARELAEEALAIDAAHTGALVRLAYLELDANHVGEAARLADLALESDPVDRGAHTVAGHVALARGDDAAAEQHARFVLNQNASDEDGHHLWVAVQARRSRLLGAWWRWNSWMWRRDDATRIAYMIGAFVVAQVAIILVDEAGYEGATRFLRLAWLGICVYTWSAPARFRKMLARALGSVQLDPEF